MTKLLIDTSVWLDLAKNIEGEKLIDLLSEFLSQNEVSLIVPEIIISEFNRNRDRVISNAGKSMSSHFTKVKEVIRNHSKGENKEQIINLLSDLNHKIPTFGESIVASLEKIENFFKKAEVLPLTDEIKLRAAQRAIDKKAPFHLSKNSIGDAIIIETYNEYVQKNIFQEFKLMFITHNIHDFSNQNGNQKMPHGDFKSIFDNNKSKYFINILEALREINPDLLEETEFFNNWEFEIRGYSEMLEVEKELEEKIWYNRHQNYAYQIETGKIKLISRKDFTIEKSKETIIKDIWAGAKKSALKIEKKYGKGNLIWDDFEWGMINGKLSAIRWVTGNEWDFLDT